MPLNLDPRKKNQQSISFGQRGHLSVSANPQSSRVGTTIHFSVSNIPLGDDVLVEIFDPSERCLYSNQINANENGNIGELSWATSGQMPGKYKFVAKCKQKGLIDSASLYFNILTRS